MGTKLHCIPWANKALYDVTVDKLGYLNVTIQVGTSPLFTGEPVQVDDHTSITYNETPCKNS